MSDGSLVHLLDMLSISGTKRFAEIAESQDLFASDSGSLEFGIETAYSSTIEYPRLNSDYDEMESNTSTEVVQIVPPATKMLKTSMLDTKITRKLEIETFHRKILQLMNEKKVSRQEIVVSPEDLFLSQTHNADDCVIQRMCDELESNPALLEIDPIVVIERPEGYEVISGNKKVAAYKASMQRRVHVCKISKNDQHKYILHNYLFNKGHKESDIVYLMTIIRMLLNQLQLSKALLSTWSSAQKNFVFGPLAGPLTSFRFLIDVCLDDALEQSVMKLAKEKPNIPNHLLRDIVRKHHHNPNGLLCLLEKEWSSVDDLRKEVARVMPDLEHSLKLKHVSPEVACRLSQVYGSDEQFLEFVRISDLRCVKKNQEKSIINRFEIFKEKSLKRKKTDYQVVRGTLADDFDVLITANEDTAQRVLNEKPSIFVIIVGTAAKTEPHYLLILPDSLGVEDTFGRLQTHMSISFAAKHDGQNIAQDEISCFMAQKGVRNRAVFMVSQLKVITQSLQRVYADIAGILEEELSLSLCMLGTTLIVNSQKAKQKLDFLIRKGDEATTSSSSSS